MPSRAARSVRPMAVAGIAVLALAACTNTQAPAAKGPRTGTATAALQGDVQVVTITATNDYRFHPSTLVVHRGRVKVILKNTETNGAPHNLKVYGFPGGFVPAAAAGTTTTASFTAPAVGSYRFVCTFHVRQGQTGTLKVLAGRP